MSSFRFLHAADIHLDSATQGLTRLDESVAAYARAATRTAFDRLVDLAVDERVDFLVIAGDLYDGDWPDYNTGLFFVARMSRLRAAGIPVYLLHGNHDAESQITKRLQLPDNVHVFGAHRAETFHVEGLDVVLHGRSFQQRDVADNLVPGYPPPAAGMFNIGVLHTGLGGRSGHANYAPCSLDELVNKGYDYWALGHVHRGEVLHERPHIVFPGNLQGRHARETGPKGAQLVSVEGGEIVDCGFVACDSLRWTVLGVPVGEARDMSGVNECIRRALTAAIADEADGRLLICRIALEGRTGLHSQLLISGEQAMADARAIALGFGDGVAWVEKLVVDTVAPSGPAVRGDAVGELQDMLREARDDAELLGRIQGDIGVLVSQLPHDVRAEIEDGALKSVIEGDYRAIIADAVPYLFARLTDAEH